MSDNRDHKKVNLKKHMQTPDENRKGNIDHAKNLLDEAKKRRKHQRWFGGGFPLVGRGRGMCGPGPGVGGGGHGGGMGGPGGGAGGGASGGAGGGGGGGCGGGGGH